MAENNLHEGHRKRLKKEILEQDFSDSIPTHKVLETLLFYGIPRKDTNPIAHELLLKFGSLSGVLEASPSDLLQVKGMTENAVTLLKLIVPLYRRYKTEREKKRLKFSSVEEIGDYLMQRYTGYTEEVFMVMFLKQDGSFIACDIISKGDSGMVALTIKSVVQKALQYNAPDVVISHNHPNGNALPSRADVEMTKRLQKTLQEINVRLIDHIIIGENDYISFIQTAELRPMFIIE